MPAARATASIETRVEAVVGDDRLGGVEQLLAPRSGAFMRVIGAHRWYYVTYP